MTEPRSALAAFADMFRDMATVALFLATLFLFTLSNRGCRIERASLGMPRQGPGVHCGADSVRQFVKPRNQ